MCHLNKQICQTPAKSIHLGAGTPSASMPSSTAPSSAAWRGHRRHPRPLLPLALAAPASPKSGDFRQEDATGPKENISK